MLRNMDRHAPQDERKLKVGDRVRLPLDDLLRPRLPLYKHVFEVVSFGFISTSWCGPRDGSRPMWRERNNHAHMVHLRRLADGWTCFIAASYVTHYRDEVGEWWLDEGLGHRNIERLALMRGDLPQALWSISLELSQFTEACWRRKQALLEIARRDRLAA